jgi:hypothetical protein
MKPKELAITLRQQGYTYTYISEKTGLSKSTLSYHLAQVPFEPNEYSRRTVGNARIAAARTLAKQKQDTLTAASAVANSVVGSLSERDLIMLGIGLYIGEGSKTQDAVRLVNSSVDVIKLYLKWLYALGVPKDNVFIRLHIYPDVDEVAAKKYWSRETNIPLSRFDTSCIDTRTNKVSTRKKPLQYGTAHVSVKALGNKKYGVQLAREISAYMQKVLR